VAIEKVTRTEEAASVMMVARVAARLIRLVSELTGRPEAPDAVRMA
jgi:hypothetical protein